MSVILGYESPAGEEQPSGVRVESQGTHRLAAACKAELIAALQHLKPR